MTENKIIKGGAAFRFRGKKYKLLHKKKTPAPVGEDEKIKKYVEQRLIDVENNYFNGNIPPKHMNKIIKMITEEYKIEPHLKNGMIFSHNEEFKDMVYMQQFEDISYKKQIEAISEKKQSEAIAPNTKQIEAIASNTKQKKNLNPFLKNLNPFLNSNSSNSSLNQAIINEAAQKLFNNSLHKPNSHTAPREPVVSAQKQHSSVNKPKSRTMLQRLRSKLPRFTQKKHSSVNKPKYRTMRERLRSILSRFTQKKYSSVNKPKSRTMLQRVRSKLSRFTQKKPEQSAVGATSQQANEKSESGEVVNIVKLAEEERAKGRQSSVGPKTGSITRQSS
jgi:hypothetical protein